MVRTAQLWEWSLHRTTTSASSSRHALPDGRWPSAQDVLHAPTTRLHGYATAHVPNALPSWANFNAFADGPQDTRTHAGYESEQQEKELEDGAVAGAAQQHATEKQPANGTALGTQRACARGAEEQHPTTQPALPAEANEHAASGAASFDAAAVQAGGANASFTSASTSRRRVNSRLNAVEKRAFARLLKLSGFVGEAPSEAASTDAGAQGGTQESIVPSSFPEEQEEDSVRPLQPAAQHSGDAHQMDAGRPGPTDPARAERLFVTLAANMLPERDVEWLQDVAKGSWLDSSGNIHLAPQALLTPPPSRHSYLPIEHADSASAAQQQQQQHARPPTRAACLQIANDAHGSGRAAPTHALLPFPEHWRRREPSTAQLARRADARKARERKARAQRFRDHILGRLWGSSQPRLAQPQEETVSTPAPRKKKQSRARSAVAASGRVAQQRRRRRQQQQQQQQQRQRQLAQGNVKSRRSSSSFSESPPLAKSQSPTKSLSHLRASGVSASAGPGPGSLWAKFVGTLAWGRRLANVRAQTQKPVRKGAAATASSKRRDSARNKRNAASSAEPLTTRSDKCRRIGSDNESGYEADAVHSVSSADAVPMVSEHTEADSALMTAFGASARAQASRTTMTSRDGVSPRRAVGGEARVKGRSAASMNRDHDSLRRATRERRSAPARPWWMVQHEHEDENEDPDGKYASPASPPTVLSLSNQRSAPGAHSTEAQSGSGRSQPQAGDVLDDADRRQHGGPRICLRREATKKALLSGAMRLSDASRSEEDDAVLTARDGRQSEGVRRAGDGHGDECGAQKWQDSGTAESYHRAETHTKSSKAHSCVPDAGLRNEDNHGANEHARASLQRPQRREALAPVSTKRPRNLQLSKASTSAAAASDEANAAASTSTNTSKRTAGRAQYEPTTTGRKNASPVPRSSTKAQPDLRHISALRKPDAPPATKRARVSFAGFDPPAAAAVRRPATTNGSDADALRGPRDPGPQLRTQEASSASEDEFDSLLLEPLADLQTPRKGSDPQLAGQMSRNSLPSEGGAVAGASVVTGLEHTLMQFALRPDAMALLVLMRQLADVSVNGSHTATGERMSRQALLSRLRAIAAVLDGYPEEVQLPCPGKERLATPDPAPVCRSPNPAASSCAPPPQRAGVRTVHPLRTKKIASCPSKGSALPARKRIRGVTLQLQTKSKPQAGSMEEKEVTATSLTRVPAANLKDNETPTSAESPARPKGPFASGRGKANAVPMQLAPAPERLRRGAALKAAAMTSKLFHDPWQLMEARIAAAAAATATATAASTSPTRREPKSLTPAECSPLCKALPSAATNILHSSTPLDAASQSEPVGDARNESARERSPSPSERPTAPLLAFTPDLPSEELMEPSFYTDLPRTRSQPSGLTHDTH
ncbi:hypothetical protein K437DRAFT_276596 [Tilletiaria anomala UBC 951]|uniref:Uncharacterized protein n=1 Tax=Tilletiaria anomala (strain ATCC 24038 / CBS 436.72 / UBC 951) TaxID=1037660 RepID=A0A066VET3_TILAU|nr:uncharacterized protein K437DRAFT_276596 [Tilletiaria anomala UBC 951]KDN37264.1 hypothetical protein K437DRAFT_276596 [Tilletiaria anomala UBC 951]